MSLGNSFKRISTEFNVGWTVYKFMKGFKPLCPGASNLGAQESKNVSLINQHSNLLDKNYFGKFCLIFPQPDVVIKKNITDPSSSRKINIELPIQNLQITHLDLPFQIEKEVIEPVTINIEKKAKMNMILVRRRKMKIHKRKKFQKKFKTEIAKRKLRREMAKEEVFQKSVKAILSEAETFSPEKYVNETLEKCRWERPVTRVRGLLAPKWVIKQYLEEKEEKENMDKRIEECMK